MVGSRSRDMAVRHFEDSDISEDSEEDNAPIQSPICGIGFFRAATAAKRARGRRQRKIMPD